MWTLIQTESHGGYNRIGYIDGHNPEYGTVMAMYRVNNYGDLDFYYQYEMDEEVVASFEYWARRVIDGLETKKETITKCVYCCHIGDKYSLPDLNDKIDIDFKNPHLKHYYCCCRDSERYTKDVTNEIVSHCACFEEA